MADTSLQKKESAEVERVERTRSGRTFLPATDILENENEIIVMADMPGADEKSIDITLDNKQLTILGTVNPSVHPNMETVYSEYEMGDYYRAFTLSDTIAQDQIKARFQDGVLTLTLPKAEEAKSRKISVQGA